MPRAERNFWVKTIIGDRLVASGTIGKYEGIDIELLNRKKGSMDDKKLIIQGSVIDEEIVVKVFYDDKLVLSYSAER